MNGGNGVEFLDRGYVRANADEVVRRSQGRTYRRLLVFSSTQRLEVLRDRADGTQYLALTVEKARPTHPRGAAWTVIQWDPQEPGREVAREVVDERFHISALKRVNDLAYAGRIEPQGSGS